MNLVIESVRQSCEKAATQYKSTVASAAQQLRASEFQLAAVAAKQALASNSTCAPLWSILAAANVGLGAFSDAADTASEGLRCCQTSGAASYRNTCESALWLQRGIALREQTGVRSAEFCFRRAVALVGATGENSKVAAVAAAQLAATTAQLKVMRAAVERAMDQASSIAYAGKRTAQTQQQQLQSYLQVVQLDPTHVKARCMLTFAGLEVTKELKETDDARAAAFFNHTQEEARSLAKLCDKEKMISGAADETQEVSNLGFTADEHAEVYCMVAECDQRQGNIANACEAYEKAASLAAADGTYRATVYSQWSTCLIEDAKAQARVHDAAVQAGVWQRPCQRPIELLRELRAQPWWDAKTIPLVAALEASFEDIQQEAHALLAFGSNGKDTSGSKFASYKSQALRKGNWSDVGLYFNGRENRANHELCPRTVAALRSVLDCVSCVRGSVYFSKLAPGSHIGAHCGPTNCRLRVHLGIVVPNGCRMRVHEEVRPWVQGKCFVFDDSFEHEVWHDGDETRLVLICDIWHPDLATHEARRALLRGAYEDERRLYDGIVCRGEFEGTEERGH